MLSSHIDYLNHEQLTKLKQLFACDQLRLLAKEAGGNSKVFCVEANDKKWAVKSYPPYAPNQRDRLSAESSVYQFLHQAGIQAVPAYQTVCQQERWLIIEWIDGHIPATYVDSDIQQAVDFIRAIAQLNLSPAAQRLPLAAEACLSLDIILQQILKRYDRLFAVSDSEPALQDFLTHEFVPVWTQCKRVALSGYRQHQLDQQAELAPQFRSLIPADFGFHNTLRNAEGRLYFFDFDYFGWDDPVKLLADILWHPKMSLSSVQRDQFIEGIAGVYQHDPLFMTRFQYTLPLFGLRWVLILLNEFIPAFWQNRQHAEAHQHHEQAKQSQLVRAKQWMLAVRETTDVFGQN